jgi:hypothetical protein
MDRHAQTAIRVAHAGLALALTSLGLCGCLDNKLAEDPASAVGEKRVFIAQQRDFGEYRDWMTYEKDVTDDHGGVVGTTTVYLNEMPEDGAEKFPVGTMLVKTMEPADASRLTIHAMVKRGSTFNAMGALGWEFFELALNKNQVPIILWRGADPPSGEMYQQLLSKNDIAPSTMDEASCNSCHANAHDGTFDDIADLLTSP